MLETIDLMPFCDKESCRYGLDSPWVDRGMLFATDARIMIALPTDEPDSPPREGKKKRPDCWKILKQYEDVEPHATWTNKFPPCAECGLTGMLPHPVCEPCKGTGMVDRNGHPDECMRCGGGGYMSVSHVNPDSKTKLVPCYAERCPVTIHGGRFHRRYVNMIDALPGEKLFAVKREYSTNKFGRLGCGGVLIVNTGIARVICMGLDEDMK